MSGCDAELCSGSHAGTLARAGAGNGRVPPAPALPMLVTLRSTSLPDMCMVKCIPFCHGLSIVRNRGEKNKPDCLKLKPYLLI